MHRSPDLLYESGPVITTRAVFVVSILAVSNPVVLRITLLLAPLFVILAVLSSLLAHFYFAYRLDSELLAPGNPLSHAARSLAFSTSSAWQVVLTRSQ